MGGALGWLSTLWSLGVTDKDGEDVRKLREQRLGDRVIKRVNKFVANVCLGLMAQCAMYLWVSSPFILNAQIKASPIGAKTSVLSWTPQFKYPCLKQKVSGNSLSAYHWFFLIWAMGSQEKGFKYCQAQGQTWNVKSKLDPEIGSVMGWPTTTTHPPNWAENC